MSKSSEKWTVIDLFSGAGGMSYGFHAHPRFRLIGAVDAQIGKPSTGRGRLECNSTYRANIGIDPLEMDLGKVAPEALKEQFAEVLGKERLAVLISCAPCTGFSRTLSHNHLQDDPRNSLAGRLEQVGLEVPTSPLPVLRNPRGRPGTKNGINCRFRRL